MLLHFSFLCIHFHIFSPNGSFSVAPLILWISQKWNKTRFQIVCGCMFHFEINGFMCFFPLFSKFNWSILFFCHALSHPFLVSKRKQHKWFITHMIGESDSCILAASIVCKVYFVFMAQASLCLFHYNDDTFAPLVKKKKNKSIVHCLHSHSFSECSAFSCFDWIDTQTQKSNNMNIDNKCMKLDCGFFREIDQSNVSNHLINVLSYRVYLNTFIV